MDQRCPPSHVSNNNNLTRGSHLNWANYAKVSVRVAVFQHHQMGASSGPHMTAILELNLAVWAENNPPAFGTWTNLLEAESHGTHPKFEIILICYSSQSWHEFDQVIRLRLLMEHILAIKTCDS